MLAYFLLGYESTNYSRFLQKYITKYVAGIFIWPQTYEIPILDPSR